MRNAYQRPIFSLWKSAFSYVMIASLCVYGLMFLEVKKYCPPLALWIFTAFILAISSLNIIHCIHRLFWSFRTNKRNILFRIIRYIKLYPNIARFNYELSKIAANLALSIYTLNLGLYIKSEIIIFILFYFVSVNGVVIVRIILPPAALYLGTSEPRQIRLLTQINARLIPGVVGLLDASLAFGNENEEKIFNFTFISMTLIDYSTRGDDWHTTVEEIANLSTLILADTRTSSLNLLKEINMIFENKLTYKTFFISDDNGNCPALAAEDLEGRYTEEKIFKLTEADIPHLLKRLSRIPP